MKSIIIIGKVLILSVLTTGALMESVFSQSNNAEAGGDIAIYGSVVDAKEKTPLPGASITVEGLSIGTVTGDSGIFRMVGLDTGLYVLSISHIGYHTKKINCMVRADQTVEITVALSKRPLSLKGIRVSPGQFTLSASEPAGHQTMTTGTMETFPQIVNDIFRAARRLPGVTSQDYSTRLRVRGGEYDEVYAAIDGLQLYEPFHIRDLDGGAMSIIDMAAVEKLDLMTGGFPAEFGDKMSGVMNIRSRKVPPDQLRFFRRGQFHQCLSSVGRYIQKQSGFMDVTGQKGVRRIYSGYPGT